MNRAKAKEQVEDYKGAVDDYSKVIDINPGFAQAYRERASLRNMFRGVAGVQNHAGSFADLNKAIELEPNHYETYLRRAYFKMGDPPDYRGAIADFSMVIKFKPKYAEAYTNRGISKIKLGQKSDGCLDLQYAAELKDYWGMEFFKENCK